MNSPSSGKSKTETRSGHCCTPPELRHTQGGHRILEFYFNDGKVRFQCIAWNEVADLLQQQSILDVQMTIRGITKDDGTFNIYSAMMSTEVADTRPQIVKAYGSREKYAESLAARILAAGKLGKVPVWEESEGRANLTFHPKDACVEAEKGSWQLKIDYCMDILGAKYVHDALYGKLQWASSSNGNGFSKPIGYTEALERLVKEACGKETSTPSFESADEPNLYFLDD